MLSARLLSRSVVTTARTAARNYSADLPGFPGAVNSRYTEKLDFCSQRTTPTIPTYRVLSKDGEVLDKDHLPKELDETLATKIYRDMVTLSVMDAIMYEAQRQGRISFYMTNYGEEATHMGSAAALDKNDVVFGQYREAGVLLYRGFTLDEFMSQCYSNVDDPGKGRQMPIHYGSARLNFHTISSPLATQIPQAAGAAYALKRANKPNVTVCYFGEGAASEGDFHAALNMAATTGSPCLFFCRNNGVAISTPVVDQYRGDGIASRGNGYGIDSIRVDGNDVFAVYNATKAAREAALRDKKPILIEALTYRVGHHSTSDDSSAYRSKKEVELWKTRDNPTTRFRKFLEASGWWSQTQDDEHKQNTRKEILAAFSRAETKKKPALDNLFTDVYDKLTPALIEQQAQLNEHIKKYPEHYPINDYAK